MSESISFEREGRGRAVIVLHPTGLGPAPMQPLVERLSDHYLVVLPARRGYGPGPLLPAPTRLDDHLDDVVALLDRLDLASATFVGVSAGATLVLALAIRHPEVVEAGLAHEPLIGPLAPELHAGVSEAIDQMLASPSPKALAAFVADLIGADAWNHLRPQWREGVEANAAAARAEAPLYPTFSPSEAELAGLAGRGIVASVGSRSGPARNDAAEVLRQLGLSCPVIAGAGHLAHLEAPDEFDRLVASLPRQAEGALMAVVAHTSPYPWPYDADLVPARLALLIAGADAHWVGRSSETRSVVDRLNRVADEVRDHGGLVVHLDHDPPPRAPDVQVPPVSDPAVARHPDDLVVTATGIDGFFGSALDRRLRAAHRDQLVLAGFGLEAPVHSTLRSANDAGYECLLLTDASAALDPALAGAAVSMVTMSGGIFGALGTSIDLLAALAVPPTELSHSSHPPKESP